MPYQPGTLASYTKSPFTRGLQFSKAPIRVQDVVTAIKDFRAAAGLGPRPSPEQEALCFYLLNHAFSLVSSGKSDMSVLSEDERKIADLYLSTSVGISIRAFYYLLLICTRESRHAHTGSFWGMYKSKFGSVVHDFTNSIKGSGSDGAVQAFQDTPPDTTIGVYTEALVYCFYNAKFSGGYGGSAWGKVADCLHSFVTGSYSGEMLVDTVWTLCHNNGPIFNKGMLYTCHSKELIKILDVQRSGQIPNLLHDIVTCGMPYLSYGYITNKVLSIYKEVTNLLPALQQPLDWHLVESLGSVHLYPQHKKEQVAKYGLSSAASAAEKKNQEMQGAKEALALKKQYEEEKAYFFITPKEKVKKLTRAELHAY